MSSGYWFLIGYLLTAMGILNLSGRFENTRYGRFAWPLCCVGVVMVLILFFVGIFWDATTPSPGCQP